MMFLLLLSLLMKMMTMEFVYHLILHCNQYGSLISLCYSLNFGPMKRLHWRHFLAYMTQDHSTYKINNYFYFSYDIYCLLLKIKYYDVLTIYLLQKYNLFGCICHWQFYNFIFLLIKFRSRQLIQIILHSICLHQLQLINLLNKKN